MDRPEDILYVDMSYLEALGHGNQAAAFSFERIAGMTMPSPNNDLPHRHNFQEIIFILSGRGRHATDGQPAELLPQTVSLIAKGQVHDFEYAEDLTGYLIRFADDFLPADLVSQTWDYRTVLFNNLGLNNTLVLSVEDAGYLTRCLDLLEAEWLQHDPFQRHTMLRHLLALVILRLGRIYQGLICTNPDAQAAFAVYQAFASLLEQHFRDRHDVQYYADALTIAPIKLAKMLHAILGKTTKQIIDERIVLEAKRQLQYTQRNVGEIAYALGYSDQFHLSKTFKRLIGAAPQAYRAQYQKVT